MTELLAPATAVLDTPLAQLDPEVAAALDAELARQQGTLEMIASENFAPLAVMEAQGSVLTNKYAEGYPGRRYYGGCEYVDVVEQLAIDRVKALFGAESANVQPHSGAQANAAAMVALLEPGDTILGLDLAHGGHLTHGMRINFSGKLYHVVPTRWRADGPPHRHGRGRAARPRAPPEAHRRRLVRLPAPARLRRVPRDRRRGRRLPHGRHGALRRAGRRRPAPQPGAARPRRHHHHAQDARRPARRRHPVQRRRPREEDQLRRLPRPAGRPAGARHRGQGGRLQARRRAQDFRDRQQRTLGGARILADRLLSADVAAAGITVLTGGTDVHLVLVDLRDSELDGQQARGPAARRSGITVNRNAVPFDPRPPMVTSGLRIGTPGPGHPRLRRRRSSARSPTSSPPR